jgi:hypothetical protein
MSRPRTSLNLGSGLEYPMQLDKQGRAVKSAAVSRRIEIWNPQVSWLILCVLNIRLRRYD